ncbi:MAG TPA: tetratricopeptide repeat protein, partial [Phytomonospora sp.]
ICQLHGKQGRYAEAVEYGHRALRLAEESGDRWGQATGLNNLGWYYTEMGRYPQAIASAERALELCDGAGSAERRALIRDTLGYAERHLGRYQEAVVHHQESIALSREVGNRTNEAFAWEHLGDDHRDAGDTEAALRAWHTALNHYSELGHSAAAPVREKIGRTIDASTTLRGTGRRAIEARRSPPTSP